jgi:hypothetical protein
LIESKGFVGNIGAPSKNTDSGDDRAMEDVGDDDSESSDDDDDEEEPTASNKDSQFPTMFAELPNASSSSDSTKSKLPLTSSSSASTNSKLTSSSGFSVTSSDVTSSLEQKSKNSRQSGGPTVNSQRRQVGNTYHELVDHVNQSDQTSSLNSMMQTFMMQQMLQMSNSNSNNNNNTSNGAALSEKMDVLIACNKETNRNLSELIHAEK